MKEVISRLKSIYHLLLAGVGSVLYHRPSEDLYIIGVTGTKGKSSTVELINALLEAAGKKTALVSSIRFKIDAENKKNDTGMTMPGRFFLQRFLRRAATRGCQYVILEVTSQGVLQHRHRFIDFDAAVFLNLRPEHIEAHGSFDAYRAAKVKFFRDVARFSRAPEKLFFVNDEDPSKEHFIAAVNGRGEIIYFSREAFIQQKLNFGRAHIGDWLSNNFNLENAAAAVAVAEEQDVSWEMIQRALQEFKGVPGRMELVQNEPFRVVIDYAHTPDSLEKAYLALERPRKKLICVLGAAGGGRDKWKRPIMGKIAAERCNKIFLANEDPFNEDPNVIMNEIEAGIKGGVDVRKVVDRKEAIRAALKAARKGDTVVITGKGSESWIRGAEGKKIPWSDREVTRALLKGMR